MPPAPPPTLPAARSPALTGLLCGLGAFFIWGIFPLYLQLFRTVSPWEILAHRVLWSALILLVWLASRGQLSALVAEFRQPRRVLIYTFSTLLITTNWLVYIWAAQNGRVMEASLGYYINPLINVALGMVFLKERLNRLQMLAVALAAAGVLNLILGYGIVPWVALTLAVTFGSYALLRKVVAFDSIRGLTVETLLLLPFAIGLMLYWQSQGSLAFLNRGLGFDAQLLTLGIITVVPLSLFLIAGQKLTLASLGFVQYLGPSLQFLIAVFLFHEAFTQAHAITFSCIWAALAIYSADAVRRQLKGAAPPAPAP